MSTFTLTPGATTSSDSERSARALRAIGQDLAHLFPENLEIELVGDTYIVRGQGRDNTVQITKDLNMGWIQKMLRSFIPKKSGDDSILPLSRSVAIDRTYKPADIDRIYGLHSVARTRLGGSPDLHSLGERLRTIGRIVLSKQAQLLKLFSHNDSLGFQYRDSKGEVHTEELSHLALYRLQQQYFSQRETNRDKDVWEENDL